MPGLLVVAAMLATHAWLAVLTRRVRKLHRRLSLHICPEAHPITSVTAPSPSDQPITVAELLDRENQLH